VFALAALSVGASVVLAGASTGGITVKVDGPLPREPVSLQAGPGQKVIVGRSVQNDVSPALRTMRPQPPAATREFEASPNPRAVSKHVDAVDTVRQNQQFSPSMPATTLSLDGIASPGVACACYPPDTNGEVGATQYVQMVNEGFQVFNKSTGASVLGPLGITSLWNGFGGVCQSAGDGDPVVLYDQLANRWVITQFAGTPIPTDECIAVSTTSDATGTWNRYAFHLGSDFFDYPHLGVWPNAYYRSMNVFNSAGTIYLGPQPFAFDRAAMLAGAPATFVTTRNTAVFNGANDAILPADLDGTTSPSSGAAEPFLMSGQASTWKLWRFHVDFGTPASSTFTLAGNLAPAAYTALCTTTRSCVPQPGTTVKLDGVGDRGMFRLAYRRFADGHEALVGNQSVSSSGVAGIRWYEIGNATSGTPAFVQQSTYQPDTTWRWLGSAAMDGSGDLAVGFSQTGSANRWGDYSDLTVDPVDVHLLVHHRVLHRHCGGELADADRQLPLPVVRRNAAASSATATATASADVVDAGRYEERPRIGNRHELARGNQLRRDLQRELRERHDGDVDRLARDEDTLHRVVGRLLRYGRVRALDDGEPLRHRELHSRAETVCGVVETRLTPGPRIDLSLGS